MKPVSPYYSKSKSASKILLFISIYIYIYSYFHSFDQEFSDFIVNKKNWKFYEYEVFTLGTLQ